MTDNEENETIENIKHQIRRDMLDNEGDNNLIPTNPVETAHILISNSNLTEYMPEIDKELKLSNLDLYELNSTYKFANAYYGMQLLRSEQYKKLYAYYVKYEDKLTPEKKAEILEQLKDYKFIMENPEIKANQFDAANALRKAVFIPTLSRGKKGFERTKQVETINKYDVQNYDNTERKPGFMGRMFGGFNQ